MRNRKEGGIAGADVEVDLVSKGHLASVGRRYLKPSQISFPSTTSQT
jgi:hypothetical protein